jgi:hypothetical protein
MAESDKKQYNKENKSGKGYYISSQFKRVVLNRYSDLIKVPKMNKSDIICDIIKLTGISRDSIYKILKNGCVSPKNKVFEPRNNFKNSDFEKLTQLLPGMPRGGCWGGCSPPWKISSGKISKGGPR